MKSKNFIIDGVAYEVKKVNKKGCEGCAFEDRNEERIRLTACNICMFRINTIYIKLENDK